MAYNHNISVKVCGNPESSGGFGPILLLNNPSFVVEDQFYVGFDKNSFFFTITTYQTQTVYKLVKNNVRSSGAFRIGSLVIAISIPKNYKLEGGYTPYDVLCALKDEFLKKCMTCKDPVRETYEYNAGKIDGHVLDEVVEKFSLTPFDMPNRVMTTNGPVGYIVATEEKIKELFQDVNYPEFDKFKEVVVATTVHTTSYVLINNIQIPRPQKYEVIVDGKPQGNCCNLNERLKIICRSKSPLYYEDLSFVFSIQDLIDGMSHEGVVLDTVQERVSVETESWGTPKEKKIFLAISPKEYEDYFISNPQELKVTFPHCSIMSKKVVISQQRLAFTLLGNEIATLENGGIKVLTTQSKYEVTDQLLIKGELRVTVVPKERSIPAPAGNLTVKVGFSEDKDLKDKCSVDLQVINSSDGKSLYSEKGVVLKWNSQTKKYEGSFVIDRKDVSPFAFFLTCSTKNKDWRTDKIIARDNLKKVDADFSEEPRPFTDRYRKPLVCVLVIMMALVLGGLSFVLYNKLSEDDQQGVAGQGDFTEKSIEPFLHDVDRLLKTIDLKFSMVDSLYGIYKQNKTMIDEYSQSKPTKCEICKRLYEYEKVIDFIRTRQVDSIKKIVNDNRKYELFHTHRACLEQIVKDEPNIVIFVKNHKHLNSFVEITELFENNVNLIDSTYNNGAIDEEGRITAPLDEEEVMAPTQETRPKLKAGVNPSESKQSENEVSEKEKLKPSKHKTKTMHKYTCKTCGPNTWFYSQREFDTHCAFYHGEK